MTKLAERAIKIASHIGPREGKMMNAAVEKVIGAGAPSTAPDLYRKTIQGTMLDQGLSVLGKYDPQQVSLQTKFDMRRDAQIRWALSAVKAPLISAPFYFETRSKEVSALLTDLFISSGLLRSLLRSSLRGLDFGFQNHETYWVKDDMGVTWDEPNAEGGLTVKDKTFKGLFFPEKFKDLDPFAVTILKDKYGDLLGSVFGSSMGLSPEALIAAIKDRKVNILPPDKMFLFTPIFEHQNYYGEGRLEWAYDPWYWQNILYMIAMRWYERKADPPYVIYAPTVTAMPDPLTDGETEFDETEESFSSLVLAAQAVDKLRSTGSIALPSEVFYDEEGRPSATRAWHVGELDVKDMHPAFLDIINHLDKKKTRSVWASDAALSRDREVASLGAPEIVANLMVEMQNDDLHTFVDAFNDQVLRPMLRWNGIKDRVHLVTTGVLRENRGILKNLFEKVIEADMLAEQSHGRIFPGSTTQIVDREAMARELGIPHHKPDPNAPMPRPLPKPEPTDQAREGRDNISNKQTGGSGSKLKSGLAVEAAEGRAFDYASSRVEVPAQEQADDMERWVESTAARSPARDTLDTHEKAATALLLWYILRSPKHDKAGKRVAGLVAANKLVFHDGGRKFLPAAALAASLSELTAMVAQYEGAGYILDRAGSATYLARARKGLTATLGGLRQSVLDGMPVPEYIRSAIDRARNDFRNLALQTGGTFVELAREETENIIGTNVDGLLLNIENIAIRNAQQMIERIVMSTGAGRQLGMVEDVLDFRFNELYSDLTLEAHLRAAYRQTMVALSLKAGVRFFVKIPAGYREEVGLYDYVAASLDWWNALGERTKNPNPASTFGLHHGSKSYWYPVPLTERIRAPLP